MTRLTETDNGKTIVARATEPVVIALAENPTTGYRWQLDSRRSASFTLVDDQFEPPRVVSAGAGGTRVLKLRPAAKGAAVLSLVLRRPWESEENSIGHFEVHITVTP